MTRNELHQKLGEVLYIEDYGMVDILMAAVIANSLKIGDPVWLTLIGPSSGGKSQIIRPFGKMNPKFIHQIDDLTSNTLISGTLGLDGSLLGRIGTHGIVSMDDLTVLFSKSAEERATILSQFRMLYDGRYSKSSGNRKEAMEWNGYVGMIAGSTPSIYRYFSEVADMGERFLSYRMKTIDKHKAVEFVRQNSKTAKSLNEYISELFKEYLMPLLQSLRDTSLPEIHDSTKFEIQQIAEYTTLIRTPVHIDERTGFVDEFPEPEMPFRVMKQLNSIAVGLQCMQENTNSELDDTLLTPLLWTGYSLADDKRRAYLRSLATLSIEGKKLTTRNISASVGLHEEVVKRGMGQLQAIGIVRLAHEDEQSKEWEVQNYEITKMVRRLENIKSEAYESEF